MAATAEQITRLRRMVAEPAQTTYTDTELQAYIERYPLVDETGQAPKIPSTLDPDELMVNPEWSATYDLNAAAAAVWQEKASALTGDYDFEADGGSYTRSQAYRQAMQQCRWYAARRMITTVTQRPEPIPTEVDHL